MMSWDSMIMLCRSGRVRWCVGGELGGVLVLRFCVDPGGEELGVSICERATGEVLLASGDTGVCFLLRGINLILAILSFNESERCGDEGSLGDGVLLEECPGLSLEPLSLRRRLKMEGRFLILPLPLERCRKSFPTRCPTEGNRFRVSLRILVSSRGIVWTMIMEVFLSNMMVMTCTCCKPVMLSPLM